MDDEILHILVCCFSPHCSMTYIRILVDILEHEPSLKGSLNSEYLKSSIEKRKERAFVPDSDITTSAEVDFIGIGYDKTVSLSDPRLQ